MTPRRLPPAAPVDSDRLTRVETLLEVIAERQQEQHAENAKRYEAAELETRTQRHKTANALMETNGRLQKISNRLLKIEVGFAGQEEKVDGILALVPVAKAERVALDERLQRMENIVSSVKVSWKVVAGIAAALAALIGGSFKLATFFGWRP